MRNPPLPPPSFPPCKWCNSSSYIKQGHIFLCKKHYRFSQMRTTAKRHNKYVPSCEELEALRQATNCCCILCGRHMNYLASYGQDTVLTLQHDRDGSIRFLCRSCNTRHASYPNDNIYFILDNFKWCPKCKQYLRLDYFYRDKKLFKGRKTYCKLCANQYHLNWQRTNKEKYNEYQKKWRAKQN